MKQEAGKLEGEEVEIRMLTLALRLWITGQQAQLSVKVVWLCP